MLFPDNIEALVSRSGGIELHWQCTCGERGVTQMERSAVEGAA
jgi:hypothetical protein